MKIEGLLSEKEGNDLKVSVKMRLFHPALLAEAGKETPAKVIILRFNVE